MKLPEDPLFTAMSFEEVLEETGRSEVTVRRWIREGRLPKYRLDGEDIYVRRDVLRAEAEATAGRGRRGARIKKFNLAAFNQPEEDTLD